MSFDLRRLGRLACVALAAAAAACGDDDGTGPGLTAPAITVTATGATSARVTFTGSARDDGYIIQRATGAAGTFAAIDTVDAPATGSATVTFNDAGLLPSSVYSYQVATIRGAKTSAFSTPSQVTTLAPGSGGKLEITGDIAANRTLSSDTAYTIKGFVHVLSGATLTIQPGTTIYGDTATLGSSLFVLPGAKIVAVGTEANPIVFTSPRQAGNRSPGDWGGLVIIGRASTNRGQTEIEGTGTVTGTTAGSNYSLTYGGLATPNDADDSGELRYVRVEYAGYAPSLNNELNSFTFAAVGSGTKLSYLEALNGLDDSFEFFGGTVDADHLVAYNGADDDFDMSEGFRGRLQFLIGLKDTVLAPRAGSGGASTDPQGIENDGCNGSNCLNAANQFNSTPFTIPVVANFTLVGQRNLAAAQSAGGIGMMLRRGTGGYYVNGIVARWPRAGVSLRDADTYARAGSVATPDLATADLALRNVLFVETPAVFQGANGTNTQNGFDLAGNALTASAATTASVFTAFPATISSTTTAAAYDWTPTAAAATGGLATFSGRLATRATGATSTGNTLAGTAYVGAAAPTGARWWANWTRYGWQ